MLNRSFLILGLFITASFALAQVGSNQRGNGGVQGHFDDIPAAALLTERGQQLADNLNQLRRSEASMGDRHPSRGEVQDEIKAVIEQLRAWAPAMPSLADGQALGDELPAMNEHDLRQLVLRLSAKVELLEARVTAIENKRSH